MANAKIDIIKIGWTKIYAKSKYNPRITLDSHLINGTAYGKEL